MKSIAVFFLILLSFFTCAQNYDLIKDTRDGKTYKTIQISGKVWMAENLNFGEMINSSENQKNNSTIEKFCYDNKQENCEKYGGLYQWNELMEYNEIELIKGICPEGWHIPSRADYIEMITQIPQEIPGRGNGKKFKSQTGWQINNNENSIQDSNGTNETGFTAIPGGAFIDKSFVAINERACFWTSTSKDQIIAKSEELSSELVAMFYSSSGNKQNALSLRCVRNP